MQTKELHLEFPSPRKKMTRQWLKSIFVIILFVYLLKGLFTFIDISQVRSIRKIQERIYYIQKRFLTEANNVDGNLKKMEEGFEQNVKEFYYVYRTIYKPKLTRAFQYAPTSRFNELYMKPIQPQCESKPYLLIQVHSAPLNVKKRIAIRYSWGNPDNDFNRDQNPIYSYRTIFVVGQSKANSINSVLHEEAKQYGDMLLTNFTDDYRKLSDKTMFTLRWSNKSCLPKYMLKTDDDCFVNVQNILKFLSHQNTGKLYTGRVQWFMPANRDKTSKFFIPKNLYSKFLLPPYVSGGGYLFSGELIPKLLNASQYIKTIPNEDANTGLLMYSLKIIPVENNHILPYIYCNESIWIRPTCDFLDPFVIHGVQNYAQMWIHYNVKVLKRIHGICIQSLRYRRQLDPPLYCPTDNTI